MTIEFDLYWSLLCTTLISVLNLATIYTKDMFYYDCTIILLLEYLVFDLCKRLYTNNMERDVTIHHLFGISGVLLSLITRSDYVDLLIIRYMTYEISTIFLNLYFITKDKRIFLVFFLLFTIIRIIYGTWLMYVITFHDNDLSLSLSFIVIPFQCLNYYWFYLITKKVWININNHH